MSLKENLIEELQKLRVSRERPHVLQAKGKGKKEKTDKHLEEAKRLFAEMEGDKE